jgi:hypothetical protein
VQYGVIMWLSVTAIVIVGVLVAARLGLGIGIRLARSIELIPLATISTSIGSAWGRHLRQTRPGPRVRQSR